MNKVFLAALISMTVITINAKMLHSEKSLYRNIIVVENQNQRCMIFGRYSLTPDYQGCFKTNDPEYLVFSYTKLVMAGLFIVPYPKSILIIGLGSGTLPSALERLYPTTNIETVEIDQAVVRVAKKWFNYKEGEQQKVTVLDGRVFIKRQLRKKIKYDIIILDAFNADYIPEHLMTQEFLSEIKQLIAANGLLIANTFSNNALYNHESVTYQNVFDNFYYVHSNHSGNRIIFANSSNTYQRIKEIRTGKILLEAVMDKNLAQHLAKIGVDFDVFEQRVTDEPDWKQGVRPLTDQYSPANLLNQ